MNISLWFLYNKLWFYIIGSDVKRIRHFWQSVLNGLELLLYRTLPKMAWTYNFFTWLFAQMTRILGFRILCFNGDDQNLNHLIKFTLPYIFLFDQLGAMPKLANFFSIRAPDPSLTITIVPWGQLGGVHAMNSSNSCLPIIRFEFGAQKHSAVKWDAIWYGDMMW